MKRKPKPKETCYTCIYREYSKEAKEYFCNCEVSDGYALECMYGEKCECWEGKTK